MSQLFRMSGGPHRAPPQAVASDRRQFLRGLAAAGASACAVPLGAEWAAGAAPPAISASARAVRSLYDALTREQKKAICFDWNHPGRGMDPLRRHVSNNWAVSGRTVRSFTPEQQGLIEDVLASVLSLGWREKLARQAREDTGRDWKDDRKVAIFVRPGEPCQCVITGFHLTLRAVSSGDSGLAFGGAIAHGHQPSGLNERRGHPGNILRHQAVLAHGVYRILDGRQRKKALLTRGMPWYEFGGRIDRRTILPDSKLDRPLEPDVRFRGPRRDIPGLPVGEMTRDQKQAVREVLRGLLEPYRPEYQGQVLACLARQGGLDRCHLIFYREHTLGREGEWDNWRLEGPSFVWFFRGAPHVHIWAHVADSPDVSVSSHFG